MLTYKEWEEKKNLLETIHWCEDQVGPSHHLVQSILFVIHPCIRKPLSDRSRMEDFSELKENCQK